MRNDKDNLIVNLTFKFSLEVINFSEQIRILHKYEMASQILEKPKMLRVKQTLFISLKSLQKKQMS